MWPPGTSQHVCILHVLWIVPWHQQSPTQTATIGLQFSSCHILRWNFDCLWNFGDFLGKISQMSAFLLKWLANHSSNRIQLLFLLMTVTFTWFWHLAIYQPCSITIKMITCITSVTEFWPVNVLSHTIKCHYSLAFSNLNFFDSL